MAQNEGKYAYNHQQLAFLNRQRLVQPTTGANLLRIISKVEGLIVTPTVSDDTRKFAGQTRSQGSAQVGQPPQLSDDAMRGMDDEYFTSEDRLHRPGIQPLG